LAPRLGFWVRQVFLLGFKLECGGFAGEGFAEALAGFVAPVGVILA
jgi:hypothetical protein